MEELTNTLKDIIDSELLASSPGQLVKRLGSGVKSALYRIRNGNAKMTSIATFFRYLGNLFDDVHEEIAHLSLLLSAYACISGALKHEPIGKDPLLVVTSFVSGDFSCFSKEFVEKELPQLIRYADEMPEAFYRALFYYYVRETETTFYLKSKSYRQQCEHFLLPIADRLHQIFPANRYGREFICWLTNFDIFDYSEPILWSCVMMGGHLLEEYAHPGSLELMVSSWTLPSDIPTRAYWLTDDPEQIILTLEIEGEGCGRGYYEIMSTDFETGSVKRLGFVGLHTDGTAHVSVAPDEKYSLGIYRFDAPDLIFSPFSFCESGNPFGVGNRWHLLDPTLIDTVREFDERLDDATIRSALLEGYGSEEIPGCKVTDVAVSRREVSLKLESGKTLSIARDAHDFLSDIQPSDTVAVLRRTSDDFRYVAWMECNWDIPWTERHCVIPLSEFKIG